jgi:hypothetical protein
MVGTALTRLCPPYSTERYNPIPQFCAACTIESR